MHIIRSPTLHHEYDYLVTLPCLSLDMPPPTCLEVCGHKLSPHMPLCCPLIAIWEFNSILKTSEDVTEITQNLKGGECTFPQVSLVLNDNIESCSYVSAPGLVLAYLGMRR